MDLADGGLGGTWRRRQMHGSLDDAIAALVKIDHALDLPVRPRLRGSVFAIANAASRRGCSTFVLVTAHACLRGMGWSSTVRSGPRP